MTIPTHSILVSFGFYTLRLTAMSWNAIFYLCRAPPEGLKSSQTHTQINILVQVYMLTGAVPIQPRVQEVAWAVLGFLTILSLPPFATQVAWAKALFPSKHSAPAIPPNSNRWQGCPIAQLSCCWGSATLREGWVWSPLSPPFSFLASQIFCFFLPHALVCRSPSSIPPFLSTFFPRCLFPVGRPSLSSFNYTSPPITCTLSRCLELFELRQRFALRLLPP